MDAVKAVPERELVRVLKGNRVFHVFSLEALPPRVRVRRKPQLLAIRPKGVDDLLRPLLGGRAAEEKNRKNQNVPHI